MRNEVGLSSTSHFTLADVPEPPGRPLVNALASRSVNLSWTPPIDAHHSPVTHYLIRITEDEDDDTAVIATRGNSTFFEVSDLKPFTTYSFSVVAVNAMGRSDASEESYRTVTLRTGR